MKILAIGAHQDDNEFRIGGLAQKYVGAGHEVRFLSLCNGCGGHHIMTPEQTTARRAVESARVAEYLGIRYDIWDIDDCTLMADLDTRMRLIRYIREYSPDLIISHRTVDYHADHRAAAQLVQDASYILTVPHTCPDVPAMKRMPIIVYYEGFYRLRRISWDASRCLGFSAFPSETALFPEAGKSPTRLAQSPQLGTGQHHAENCGPNRKQTLLAVYSARTGRHGGGYGISRLLQ